MMSPALYSNRHAIAWVAIIVSLLLLPVLMASIGLGPRQEVYSSIIYEAGSVQYLEHQLFVEKDPVDMLFIGGSLIQRGVDAPYMQEALSRKLGRPATVRILSMRWNGLDMQYMLLRDFIRNRQAGMVVMTMPTLSFKGDQPHVQAFRWMRYGDLPESFSGLPWTGRISVYSVMVLGAPRHLLNYFRPNIPAKQIKEIATLGSQFDEIGYYNVPFVPETITPPEVPVDSMITLRRDNAGFSWTGPELGPYHRYWARRIGDLVRERHIPIVFLHVPLDYERGSSAISERMYWPEVAGVPAPVVGVSSAALFAGVDEKRFFHFYEDQHLNLNGCRLYTRTVAPALLKLYAERVK